MKGKGEKFLERYKIQAFYLIIIIAIMPIFIYPIYSYYYHEINDMPEIENMVLDLEGYNLKEEIPLDGEWEYFHNKALVSDKLGDISKEGRVKVPERGGNYNVREQQELRNCTSSYRIWLEHVPDDIELVVHIPNITSPYKAYINGELCAVKTWDDPEENVEPYQKQKNGIKVAKGNKTEIVIEINSKVIDGLYTVPYLTEMKHYKNDADMREFITNCYLGSFLLIILYFIYIILRFRQNMAFMALSIVDIFVLTRILEKEEFYVITGRLIPLLKDYRIVSCIQIVTLFLPVAILYCGKQMLSVKLNKKLTRGIFCYEIVIAIFVGISAFSGNPVLQYYFVVASYLPFFFVLYKLYEQVKHGDSKLLQDVAALLFAIASITGSNMSLSGILVMNISLFPSTCFLVSLVLQVIVYAGENQKNYVKALEAENLELQLKKKEVELMVSQIKPHFLYNTLVTIQVLCTEEPETAAEAVLKFSRYLRTNMQFIQGDNLISFQQELIHIQNYVYIEKLRFMDRLEVLFDIKESNFFVPPFCIQPLVENAIKHGACKRLDDGGIVKLETFQEENDICIVVSDNGSGFSKQKKEKESNSYGLNNIIFRLKEVVHGEIIFSRENGLTKATVRIPKEGCYENNIN